MAFCFLLVCVVFASCRCAAIGIFFHTIGSGTEQWRDYFSPFGKNSEYFQQPESSRRFGTSPTRVFVAAGLGRTGTTSLSHAFKAVNVTARHYKYPTPWLNHVAFLDGGPTGASTHQMNNWTGLYPAPATGSAPLPPVALLDTPVGMYAWDLLDAYPNATISLTVREGDAWWESFQRLRQGYCDSSSLILGRRKKLANGAVRLGKGENVIRRNTACVANRVVLWGSSGRVPARQGLRRFFEHNSHIISASPQQKFTLIDLTQPLAEDSISRFVEKRFTTIPHLHNSANMNMNMTNNPAYHVVSMPVSPAPSPNRAPVPELSLSDLSAQEPYRAGSDSFNPQHLNLLSYMTPMASMVPGQPFSKYFFPRPEDRLTSEHPIVIGAGFEGTGLSVLKRALAVLGRARVRLPSLPMRYCNSSTLVCSTHLAALHAHGLQAPALTPEAFEGSDAVMGHPVPLLTWDFLEAFPAARVVLTVRDADDAWETLARASPRTGVSIIHTNEELVKLWVWGMPLSGSLDKRAFLRRYLMHNSKVIFGVPKDQLLVWDVHKQPEWGPLCDFLGLPVPGQPFPMPRESDL